MLFLSKLYFYFIILIFYFISIEIENEKGEIKKTGRREQLTYPEYAERMHILSLRKRKITTNKRKIFCEKVKNDWKTTNNKK
jgi:hypothetical protein